MKLSAEQTLQMAQSRQQAGDAVQAEKLYREVLAMQPNNAMALHLLGFLCHLQGRSDEAVELITQATVLDSGNPAVFLSLGEVHRCQARYDEAISLFRHALVLYPKYAAAHYNLGVTYQNQKNRDEAIQSYQRAINLEPRLAQAHNNLGALFFSQEKITESIACYRRALDLLPGYAEAHYNLGMSLARQRRFDEAIAAFQRSLAIRPDDLSVLLNLGLALAGRGSLDEAIGYYQRLLVLDPESKEVCVYTPLGNALKEQGRMEEAISAYRMAVRLEPENVAAADNLVYALHFHPQYDARAIYEEHVLWDREHGHPRRKFILPHENSPEPGRRLKIGYVSPDLRQHVVGRFLLPILENRDHNAYEAICYSDTGTPDAFTTHLRKYTDGWRETADWTEEELTAAIRRDQIDILVDLALHTAGNRLPVFARKPAPLQVTYLAYCSTSGLEAMDYRLTDPYLDSRDGEEACYSEISVRLPETYWCLQAPPVAPERLSPLPALKTDGVTFGCLNNFCKVTPEALALWVRILSAVPRSRLILHAQEGSHREQVRQILVVGGVSPERLSFLGFVPTARYFDCYEEIDIALDPFPFAGGTTTCDALWMGVPVVTLAGQTAVGRGGVSLLSNAGLWELIANNEEEYFQIARDLALDLRRLSEMRATLRTCLQNSPLMDAPRFTQNLEAAYRAMWEKWCAQQPAVSFVS